MKKSSFLALAVAPMILGAPMAATADSVATDPVGFHKAQLSQGTQLLGVSLVNPAAYAAAVATIETDGVTLSGDTVDFSAHLADGVSYYLEVTAPGSVAGHRFEVDGAATRADTGNKVVIANSSLNTADLSILDGEGAKFVIRPHVTLGQLTAEWGEGNLRSGDRVIFFVDGAFDTHAFSNGAWRRGFTVTDNQIIPPGRGFYYERTSNDATDAVFTGEVRNNHFVQPLSSGTQLLAQGFPVDASFAFAKDVDGVAVPQRNLLNGSTEAPSTVSLSQGDRVITFINGNFTTYSYNATQDGWFRGFTNDTTAEVFTPTGAVFIELAAAQPGYSYLNPVQN